MKKKTMMFIFLFFSLFMASCSTKIYELKQEAFYIDGNDGNGPYIYFKADGQSFQTGGSIAMSFAIIGTYEVKGNKITAVSKDGNIEIGMEMISETEIKIRSIKYSGELDRLWLDDVKTLVLKER